MGEIDTAISALDNRRERGIDAYHRDQRFRHISQMVVAHAIYAYGDIEPRRASEAAYRIAIDATVMLLQTIYEEDAELRNQKGIADQFRKIAEDMARLSMQRPFLPPLAASAPDPT